MSKPRTTARARLRILGYVVKKWEDAVAVELVVRGQEVEEIWKADRFVDGILPEEGDVVALEMDAKFFPHTPVNIEEYLTPEELKNGFPGFNKAIAARKAADQANERSKNVADAKLAVAQSVAATGLPRKK